MTLNSTITTGLSADSFTFNPIADFNLFDAAKGFRSGSSLGKCFFQEIPKFNDRKFPAFAYVSCIRIIRTGLKAVYIGEAYGMPGLYNKWIGATALISCLGLTSITPKVLVVTNVALTVLEYRLKPCKALFSLTIMSIRVIANGTKYKNTVDNALQWLAIPATGLAFFASGPYFQAVMIMQIATNYFYNKPLFG